MCRMMNISYNQIGKTLISITIAKRDANIKITSTCVIEEETEELDSSCCDPSFPCMLYMCATLASCQSWVNSEIQLQDSFDCTHLEFSSHSLTQPLHKSHLNIGYLIAKIQENLVWNKANIWLNKFNLTISPFGYSVTKP